MSANCASCPPTTATLTTPMLMRDWKTTSRAADGVASTTTTAATAVARTTSPG